MCSFAEQHNFCEVLNFVLLYMWFAKAVCWQTLRFERALFCCHTFITRGLSKTYKVINKLPKIIFFYDPLSQSYVHTLCQLVSQSVGHSVSWSVSQLVIQSVGQPVSQSVIRSVSQ